MTCASAARYGAESAAYPTEPWPCAIVLWKAAIRGSVPLPVMSIEIVEWVSPAMGPPGQLNVAET
jgi:hypothetical protein